MGSFILFIFPDQAHIANITNKELIQNMYTSCICLPIHIEMSKSVIKSISFSVLLATIFSLLSITSASSGYADGVVPQSSLQSFPNLDTRLIGVPIKKTEITAALVAYSNAESQLSELTNNQNVLLDHLVVLKPELVNATADLDARALQLEELQNSLNTLAITQYQNNSSIESEDAANSIDGHRRDTQTNQVLRFLLKKYKKTKSRVELATDYKTKVENKINEINSNLKTISQKMLDAQKEVNVKKAIVGSTLPVASIDGFDIPVLTMDAYLRAEKNIAVNNPNCAIPWWLIAGIGRAESNHGRFGGASMSANGTVSPSIIGVPLNGQGFASIPDTDKGFYDGDEVWDRAVGVMQFIPGTWNRWKGDGNGDGAFDPQNVYDGALATAQYLCSSAPNLASDETRRGAVLAYNHSNAYADFVLAKGHEYEALGAGKFNVAPAVPVEATPAP